MPLAERLRAARVRLDRFFFAAEPPARLLLFRRLLAGWTIAYLLPRVPHVDELYCRDVLNDGVLYRWFGYVPSEPLALAWLGALLVALVGCVAGRGGRVAGVVACALFLGLMMAEASVPRAYSELAAVQWVLLLFAPAPRRAVIAPPEPRWATRLLMLQLSAVYLFAGLGKLIERGWWGGEAVVRVLRSPHYGDFLVSSWGVIEVGPLAVAIAWATISAELFVAIGLWLARARWAAVGVMIALHLGIALTMRISPLFHALMLAHIVLFVGGRRGWHEVTGSSAQAKLNSWQWP